MSNMQSYLVCRLNVNLNLQIEITEILTTTVHICGTQWYFGQENNVKGHSGKMSGSFRTHFHKQCLMKKKVHVFIDMECVQNQ